MWKKCLLILCINASVHALTLRCGNPVTFVDGQTGSMENPRIACNSQGDALLFVTTYSRHPQKPDEKETLYAAFKEGSNLWSEPQPLHQAEEIYQVKTVVDAAGHASFCWIEGRDNKKNVYYGQKTKDDFWIAPFCHDFKGSSIDLLPNGEMIFIGHNIEDMGHVIQTNRHINYQFFNMYQRDPTEYYYSSWGDEYRVSFNQQSEGVAIKGFHRNNNHGIRASWYQNSEWTSPQIILQRDTSTSVFGHQVFKGNDLTVFCWKENDDLHLLTFLDGQTSSNQFSVGYDYAVSLGPNDEVYVVGQSEKDCLDLFYKDIDHKWHTSSLHLPSPGGIFEVSASVDAHGNCLIVWECGAKVLKNLRIKSKSVVYGAIFSAAKQEWSAPVMLSPTYFSCNDPSVALSGEGHGFITWEATNWKDRGVQVVEIFYGE